MRAIVLRDGVLFCWLFFQFTGRFDLFCWLAMIPLVLATRMEEESTLLM